MSENMLATVMKDAIATGLLMSAPILITAILVGLIISIFQATTQIQEQTLTFVPKLLGIALVGIISGRWMLHILVGFTQRIFEMIANITM